MYTRSPALVSEIGEALTLSPAKLAAWIRATGYGNRDGTHRRKSTYFSPEALVYLVRHHGAEAERLEAGDPANARLHAVVVGLASNALVAEMDSVVSKLFNGLAEVVRERAEGRLLEWLLRLLPDTTGGGDALETSFGLIVKRRAITFAERAAKSSDAADQRISDLIGGIESVQGDGTPPGEADRKLEERDRALWDAIGALPEGLRTPFVLYTVEGIQVQSTVPGTRTLTDDLGLSSTTIYKRIHEAERLLRIALHDIHEPAPL